MSALPQARPSVERSNTRKGPARQETTPILDRYGRDPESLPEKLRALTDYAKSTGYGPFFHAAVADLPRLSSGGVCYAFVLVVNSLTYGRPRGAKAPVNVWTLPISAADLAEYCRANVRDIQRQLSELEERGMIAVKQVKQGGTVRYSISLLYSSWQALEDYAVWKRRQVVAIDEGEDETAEDTEPLPISRDAVHLVKKPQSVRPGRASRAVKVDVGVRELSFQNDSPAVDATFNAVVESGRLVVSATFKIGESGAKGEEKGNAERHGCRADQVNPLPDHKRSKGETPRHPRADEIISLFDPLLRKSAALLLSPDARALQSACAELGGLPIDSLVHFVTVQRASKVISRPSSVASIIREARQNWEKTSKVSATDAERDSLLKALGLPVWSTVVGMQGKHGIASLKQSLRRSVADPEMTEDQQDAAKRLLEILS